MKRIVVINNNDRALNYGIGAYTTNLIECLKTTDFAFDIIYLNAEVYEFKISANIGFREFFIPAFVGSTNTKLSSYCQMIPFLLKELFCEEDEFIFHFNYFLTGPLMVTNIYENYEYKEAIYIMPSEIVAPLNKVEVNDYINNKDLSPEFITTLEKKMEKAKAVHYFIGSWY